MTGTPDRLRVLLADVGEVAGTADGAIRLADQYVPDVAVAVRRAAEENADR